jgi:hypothetical protein
LGDKTLMTFTEKFKAKYAKKPQNLPIIEQKKPILSKCYSCECYEREENLSSNGPLHWCVTSHFSVDDNRPVTDWANIELMEICPKKGKKRTYFKKL